MAVTEESLMAFADGELSAADTAAVEAAMAADPALAAKIEAHRATRAAVSGAYGGVLAEPTPERLLAAVRGSGGANHQVVDLAERRAERAARRWPLRNVGAMAACLVLGLAVGIGLQPPPRIIQMSGEGLVAHGDLAMALEGQLASQASGGPVKVALSYRNAGGAYCRTFRTSGADAVAGVACKDAKQWRIQLAVSAPGAGRPAGGYREAGSQTPPAIIGEVERTISGAPLDANAEAAARARHWR